MTKVQLEKELKENQKKIDQLEVENSRLSKENEVLKDTLLIAKSNESNFSERILQLEEHIKDMTLDFTDPLEASRIFSKIFVGKRVDKVTEFIKHLVANYYRNLKITIERQKNSLIVNQKQLNKLSDICDDISNGQVGFIE